MSREARKRPTLVESVRWAAWWGLGGGGVLEAYFVQCSFSTRNSVHMPLRQISERATMKERTAECCRSLM